MARHLEADGVQDHHAADPRAAQETDLGGQPAAERVADDGDVPEVEIFEQADVEPGQVTRPGDAVRARRPVEPGMSRHEHPRPQPGREQVPEAAHGRRSGPTVQQQERPRPIALGKATRDADSVEVDDVLGVVGYPADGRRCADRALGSFAHVGHVPSDRLAPPASEQERTADHGIGTTTSRHAARRPELADFLRSRRAAVRPEAVGIEAGLRRRTPGLRREEVAARAAVGVSWYTWLEQVRAVTPSVQALEALGRALRLSPSEREYLFLLAGLAVPVTPGLIGVPLDDDTVAMVAGLALHPAYVLGPTFDVPPTTSPRS